MRQGTDSAVLALRLMMMELSWGPSKAHLLPKHLGNASTPSTLSIARI
jgi:hypothetical protein